VAANHVLFLLNKMWKLKYKWMILSLPNDFGRCSLCLHFVTRFNPCDFTRRQRIHCLVVISSRSWQKKLGMWIVTVVWCLDRNVRSPTWCYSNTSWTMPTQQKWNTTACLLINNRQFCIICHLTVCPAPVLHSSKTHQHSSRRTRKTPSFRPCLLLFNFTVSVQIILSGEKCIKLHAFVELKLLNKARRNEVCTNTWVHGGKPTLLPY